MTIAQMMQISHLTGNWCSGQGEGCGSCISCCHLAVLSFACWHVATMPAHKMHCRLISSNSATTHSLTRHVWLVVCHPPLQHLVLITCNSSLGSVGVEQRQQQQQYQQHDAACVSHVDCCTCLRHSQQSQKAQGPNLLHDTAIDSNLKQLAAPGTSIISGVAAAAAPIGCLPAAAPSAPTTHHTVRVCLWCVGSTPCGCHEASETLRS
jgi:hypothetical protein